MISFPTCQKTALRHHFLKKWAECRTPAGKRSSIPGAEQSHTFPVSLHSLADAAPLQETERGAGRTHGLPCKGTTRRSTDGAWRCRIGRKRRAPVGEDVLKEDQPRKGKRENGRLRGTEGMQEQAGKTRRPGRGLAPIGIAATTVHRWAGRVESKEPGRSAGIEEINAGGKEKQQGGQVEAAEPAQQAFPTALGLVLGQRREATLISHLPPLYHAMIATMERLLEQIKPPLRSLLLRQQPSRSVQH